MNILIKYLNDILGQELTVADNFTLSSDNGMDDFCQADSL
jgi:hypothetical protein